MNPSRRPRLPSKKAATQIWLRIPCLIFALTFLGLMIASTIAYSSLSALMYIGVLLAILLNTSEILAAQHFWPRTPQLYHAAVAVGDLGAVLFVVAGWVLSVLPGEREYEAEEKAELPQTMDSRRVLKVWTDSYVALFVGMGFVLMHAAMSILHTRLSFKKSKPGTGICDDAEWANYKYEPSTTDDTESGRGRGRGRGEHRHNREMHARRKDPLAPAKPVPTVAAFAQSVGQS